MPALDCFVAVSLDGRIAGPLGETDVFPVYPEYLRRLAADWGDGLPTAVDDAMGTTPPRTRWDSVVMGRGTSQPALDAGITDPYAHLDAYVLSRTLDPAAHPDVVVVQQEAVGFVRDLERRPGADIWLCGGDALAGALLGEVDRLVLKVKPVVLGDGVPLFAGAYDPVDRRLVAHDSPGADVLVLTCERASSGAPVGVST